MPTSTAMAPAFIETAPKSAARIDVRAAGESDAADWDGYLAGRPDAAGYHEWAWRGVFERTFGHENHGLMARRGGRLVGVLPLVEIRSVLFGRFLTSLPFVNYGGVLADDDEAAGALVGAARALSAARGARHVELRHAARRFDTLPCRAHKVAMTLRLDAGMWDRFDRKVRNQIRKAEKSGLVAERGGRDLLGDFYAAFARNMRDLGTPVYPRRLFAEVLAAFPGRAHLVVVRMGARPVAAGLTYRTRNIVEVPWASSIREFNSLCPNHLLYWRAIEAALDDGCDTLDFGRSTPHEGTYKFKEQWGAVPVPLHWEYVLMDGHQLPDQGPTNPNFHAAIAMWKRLPLPVANALGPVVVRGIP